MIQIGDIRVHLLLDCVTKVDAGGPFGLVPRALYKSILAPDADNLVPMVYHSLFVQTAGMNIIIDTAYGEKIPEKQHVYMQSDRSSGGQLAGLARLGIQPQDIQLVINTHLHGDHCGGNTRFADPADPARGVVATYPNAEYVVQRREYEDAMHPNERTRATYLFENYQPLYEKGQLRLLEGDCELAPGVRGVVAPGHTPGHMAIVIESQGETFSYVCDLASYAVHFERLGWMTSYDVEPLITLETKRKWQAWALETNALLLFGHDTQRPLGRYTLDEKGRGVIQPVEAVYA